MKIASEVILSNQIEKLADELKKRLFFSGASVFDRRFVIVPSATVKRFLTLYFAEDPQLKIAAGIEFFSLSQAVDEFVSPDGYQIPSILELSLEIQDQLHKLVSQRSELSENNAQLLSPLFSYLDHDEAHLQALSEQLAIFFAQYSTASRAALEKWEKEETWQQFLWKRIFAGLPSNRWDVASFALLSSSSPKFEIFVFQFFSIPPSLFEFFTQHKTLFFHLSPTQFFWGDLCGDRERVFLSRVFAKKGKRAELDSFLTGQNSFLANFSKVGKKLFNAFIDADFLLEERYSETHGSSLLNKIQENLLSSQENIPFPQDASIQIHGVYSRLEEVEILYHNLLRILHEHACKNDPIFPRDILILAPDIAPYLPYIQAVFGKETSLLKFAVFDLPKSHENEAIYGLNLLLELCKLRFDLNSVFALFSFPAFMKKWQLTSEDIDLYQQWAEKAQIYRDTTGQGSWEAGFSRLLFGLSTLYKNDLEEFSLPTWPLAIVEKNDMENLGKLISLIRSLKEDLDPLIEDVKRTPVHWLNEIQKLLSHYFLLEAEGVCILEEMREIAIRNEHLQSCVSFSSIHKSLENHLFQKKTHSCVPTDLEAVQFASLQKGAAAPARIVYLLGMEESSFPRKDTHNSLQNSSFELSKRADEDRAIFLELFLSARDYWIFSYKKISDQDGKPELPSLFIQEFASYLKNAHGVEICAQEHLPQVREKKQEGIPPFIEQFYHKTSLKLEKTESTLVIDIKELRMLAKNPLQFYLKKVMKVFLSNPSDKNEFSFSSLERAMIRTRSLKAPLSSLIKIADAQGKLPIEPFKELARRKLQNETQEIQEFLQENSVKEVCEVEWKEGCTKPKEWKPGFWVFPALSMYLTTGTHVSLVGKLTGVTDEGLIFHGENDLENLVKIWPDYLMFTLLGKKPFILWTKEKMRSELVINEPMNLLKKYLNYYEFSLANVSPFFPKWAEALLKKDVEKLQKAIVQTKKEDSYDPYLSWLLLRDSLPSADVLIANWSDLLQEVFHATI